MDKFEIRLKCLELALENPSFYLPGGVTSYEIIINDARKLENYVMYEEVPDLQETTNDK